MERAGTVKRILVTGASGQLGRSIQDIAANYPTMEFVFANSKTLDITNAAKLDKIMASASFDYCINCAAYTNVEQAEKTPEIAFKVNAEGVKTLALVCKAYDITLIHISTDYVFDGEKGSGYTVNDLTNPINEYGKSKLKGEQYIQQVLRNHFIIRTSWVYHKKHGKNFYKTILEKVQKGDTLRITNRETGCPTNAENLASFIVNLIADDNQDYGLYHFTDGQPMSWYGFALSILDENDLLNTTNIIKDNTYQTLAKRPKYSVLLSEN
ncbi:dTDP-4-dehydrorhamnose reductase [Arenibacter sp. 6A1]|uniref:dTDP-4-dehydrorhamnose reductase n=1 Tax=Arenibacter sp. 6A1 TaxID=2720391 RepID=UPI00144885FF|nr:dTDP-4-dehydrorhamnose reductase [Arenibacter sp. 6A1]NKI26857.1 dTDP-4-dehydrorhamnose reductase [Arenibacter sp. 6A1]